MLLSSQKDASTSIESSDNTSHNTGSQYQDYLDDKSHNHNCFSITNWEDNDIDNLTDDEKSDGYSNIYEDADVDSLDESLDDSTTVSYTFGIQESLHQNATMLNGLDSFNTGSALYNY